MTLADLINENLLEKINNISFDQIIRRYEKAMSYFNFVKNNLDYNSEVIYTNIYTASRILSETFLLLNGYKAKVKDHHKTVLHAAKIIMNDSRMEPVFNRIDRMRKKRHIIDYDSQKIVTISEQDLKQSIMDIQKYANKVKEFIDRKNPQEKLLK